MSHIPRITMIGLYQYNNNVFEKLELPKGIDKETFILSFLMKYGECPVIYTNYEFMRDVIGVWSKKWYNPIERIILAITDDYNPLHNFNRFEDYTDVENKRGSSSQNNNATERLETDGTSENKTVGNEKISTTENATATSDTETENTVSAYNASTYQPDTKQTVDNDSTENKETESERNYTETENGKTKDVSTRTAGGNVENENNENRDLQHTGHLYGNIGVTKSQDMLIDEISVRMNYNLYDIVSELLYREICIYTY